eukprot:scaffold1220_cov259-Pinguiococcus_pyrenoidosus.AAC.88
MRGGQISRSATFSATFAQRNVSWKSSTPGGGSARESGSKTVCRSSLRNEGMEDRGLLPGELGDISGVFSIQCDDLRRLKFLKAASAEVPSSSIRSESAKLEGDAESIGTCPANGSWLPSLEGTRDPSERTSVCSRRISSAQSLSFISSVMHPMLQETLSSTPTLAFRGSSMELPVSTGSHGFASASWASWSGGAESCSPRTRTRPRTLPPSSSSSSRTIMLLQDTRSSCTRQKPMEASASRVHRPHLGQGFIGRIPSFLHSRSDCRFDLAEQGVPHLEGLEDPDHARVVHHHVEAVQDGLRPYLSEAQRRDQSTQTACEHVDLLQRPGGAAANEGAQQGIAGHQVHDGQVADHDISRDSIRVRERAPRSHVGQGVQQLLLVAIRKRRIHRGGDADPEELPSAGAHGLAFRLERIEPHEECILVRCSLILRFRLASLLVTRRFHLLESRLLCQGQDSVRDNRLQREPQVEVRELLFFLFVQLWHEAETERPQVEAHVLLLLAEDVRHGRRGRPCDASIRIPPPAPRILVRPLPRTRNVALELTPADSRGKLKEVNAHFVGCRVFVACRRAVVVRVADLGKGRFQNVRLEGRRPGQVRGQRIELRGPLHLQALCILGATAPWREWFPRSDSALQAASSQARCRTGGPSALHRMPSIAVGPDLLPVQSWRPWPSSLARAADLTEPAPPDQSRAPSQISCPSSEGPCPLPEWPCLWAWPAPGLSAPTSR